MNFEWENDIVQSSKIVWHETETHLAQELKNESSLLAKPLSTNISVPGNIHNPEFFDFWVKVLNVGPKFQKFLQQGYALQFIDRVPPPSHSAASSKGPGKVSHN